MLLEGESLLNDASSITLFTIFLRKVEEYTHGFDTQSGLAVFGDVCKQTVWLAVGTFWPCQLNDGPFWFLVQETTNRESACNAVCTESAGKEPAYVPHERSPPEAGSFLAGCATRSPAKRFFT